MSITVRGLLAAPDLGLTALSDVTIGEWDEQLQWVHGSDLSDPTPFLTADTVLLTTGTQFDRGTGVEVDANEYDTYVARLVAGGIRGLGFGTEVSREGTPDGLITACTALGLPLFEVPYRTPFIAIVRHAADQISRAQYARDAWSLGAQRAITLAALRPNGLSATLAELSHQLKGWVALYNTAGALTHVMPSDARSFALDSGLHHTVRQQLTAGTRSSATASHGDHRVVLQTLGASGQLRGVLAVGGEEPLDAAANALVSNVVALASLALEQNHAQGLAIRHLRTAALSTILGGNVDAARDTSALLWGGLPTEPVILSLWEAPRAGIEASLAALESTNDDLNGDLFFAERDDYLVVISSAGEAATAVEQAVSSGIPSGASRSGTYAEMAELLAQARLAQQHSAQLANPQHMTFEQLADRGMWSLLGNAGAQRIAKAVLGPILDHDAGHNGDLVHTLSTWLSHNGQWAPAAAELGIHRHTLKHRIDQCERLLDRDLSGFDARAELWAALRNTE
ncbi:PucR family transcriptional regulator [Lysinibacter cavernae]|uniref:Purine catabolism regulator n=1 Tax=Lysinibacter cavernae TaxID=1640652 RepID=A0A7X5QYL9_9MICO|nr:PucR family transcriptional regulator [Lysinibacter cavernae]NIH52381.1 purine catabolism regulator [Lysinibacter cavernae]